MSLTENAMIPLLDAEPDLGRLMSAEQIEQARSQLLIRRHVVEAGPWDGELLGPGDLVRPWQAGGPERLVPYEVRWTALERTALGVLDRRFALALSHYPQINAMLIDRLTERSQRISLMQSISQLNGVDRRLLTLFWHL